MGYHVRPCDRDRLWLMPPALQDWVPEGALAWFLQDAVAQMDLTKIERAYRANGWGSAAFRPARLVVRRLLEYKQFKEAARQLDEHERLWREIYSRTQSPAVELELDETLLDNVSLFDLVDVLQGVLDRNPGKKFMEVLPDNLTVRERMNAILEMLEGQESVNFVELFEPACHRLVIIVTFLALLELMRLRTARVFQMELFGPILVSRAFSLVPDPAELGDAEWRGA